VFAGAYIVVLAVVLAGMLVGATVGTGLIGRDAALHVLAAAQATEPEVLLRNVSVGTALAVLVPLVAVFLWRRSQSAERSRRHVALTWMAGFGLVWAVLFVGGEAVSRTAQPGPSARPAATGRLVAPTTAPIPTRPVAALRTTPPSRTPEVPAVIPVPATPVRGSSTAPSPTATAQAAASSPTASPIRFVYVSGTSGQGLYLRGTPDWNDRLSAFVEGTRLTVFGETVGDDGTSWLQVGSGRPTGLRASAVRL
jgi:hypothetical protein